jgi:hypothetical protein
MTLSRDFVMTIRSALGIRTRSVDLLIYVPIREPISNVKLPASSLQFKYISYSNWGQGVTMSLKMRH